MNDEQIVISLNDFPEEVCAPGTTMEQARARCAYLKEEYLKTHSQAREHMLSFHAHKVRIWSAS